MIYAWINGERRQPNAKQEKTFCEQCGGTLTSVMPVENIKHWRHKAGDCDKWSEPEGEWHLAWKEYFDLNEREVGLRDSLTGEIHRADILVGKDTLQETVLELQHSNISEEERIARETFYSQNRRFFWLVHLHDDNGAFRKFAFRAGFGSSRLFEGREFFINRWVSRNTQFIEKWKRSNAYVFFEIDAYIFFLAGSMLTKKINGSDFGKGEFAVCPISRLEFINSVKSLKRSI